MAIETELALIKKADMPDLALFQPGFDRFYRLALELEYNSGLGERRFGVRDNLIQPLATSG